MIRDRLARLTDCNNQLQRLLTSADSRATVSVPRGMSHHEMKLLEDVEFGEQKLKSTREGVYENRIPGTLAILDYFTNCYSQLLREQEWRQPKPLAEGDGDLLSDLLNQLVGRSSNNIEAERLCRRALKAEEDRLGPAHLFPLATSLRLAEIIQRESPHKAEEFLREMKRQIVTKRPITPLHPDILLCQDMLAEVLCDQGKYEEAIQLCRETFDTRRDTLGWGSRMTVRSMINLAKSLAFQDSTHGEAILWYSKALRKLDKFSASTLLLHELDATRSLAYLYWKREDLVNAIRFYTSALNGYRSKNRLVAAHKNKKSGRNIVEFDVLKSESQSLR